MRFGLLSGNLICGGYLRSASYAVPVEPPWEWVEGDPVRTGQHLVLAGLWVAGSGALAVLLGLDVLGIVGVLRFPLALQWVLTLLLLAWFFVGLRLLNVFPMRYPGLSRIGFSPAGVRLLGPFGDTTIQWSAVRGVGSDWVEMYRPSAARSFRFKLTPDQAEGLSRYRRESGQRGASD